MDDRLTQRLLGTSIIIILAIIAIPDIKHLNKKDSPISYSIPTEIKSSDKTAFTFSQPEFINENNQSIPNTKIDQKQTTSDEKQIASDDNKLLNNNISAHNLITQKDSWLPLKGKLKPTEEDNEKNYQKRVDIIKNISTTKQQIIEHNREKLEHHISNSTLRVSTTKSIQKALDSKKAHEDMHKNINQQLVLVKTIKRPSRNDITTELPKPDLPKPDLPKPDLPKPDLPKPDLPKPTKTLVVAIPKMRQNNHTQTSMVVGHYALQENASSLRDYYTGQNIKATIDKIIVSGRDIYQVKIWH